ncbi:unnamed protein product [Closterium sp. NIES-64]|nr:unnamed protein product [Closterium sp. NIES-64]
MILTVTLRAAYVACSQPPLPLLASRASLDKASIRKGTDPVNCNDPLLRTGALNAEPSKARTDPFDRTDRLGTNTVLNTSGNDDVRNDVSGDARDDDGGIPLDPLRNLRPSLIGSTWQRESWRRKKRPVKTPRRPEKARPSLVEEIATAWSNDRRRRRDGRWMVDTPRGIPMCPRPDPPCPDCRGSGRVECTRCCGREVGGDDVMGWGGWMQWWARLGSGGRGDEGGTHPMVEGRGRHPSHGGGAREAPIPWWRGEGGTHPMVEGRACCGGGGGSGGGWEAAPTTLTSSCSPPAPGRAGAGSAGAVGGATARAAWARGRSAASSASTDHPPPSSPPTHRRLPCVLGVFHLMRSQCLCPPLGVQAERSMSCHSHAVKCLCCATHSCAMEGRRGRGGTPVASAGMATFTTGIHGSHPAFTAVWMYIAVYLR